MSCTVLVVDNGSRSAALIGELARQDGWQADIVPAGLAGAATRPADAVILSGTNLPVSAPGYEAEIDLIHTCEVPLLGICGGTQLIGRAYGVALDEGKAVIGKTAVRLHDGVDLFEGLPRRVDLFQRHVYRLRSCPRVIPKVTRL
jgi:GMP synthase-like glutamine amidotransferase